MGLQSSLYAGVSGLKADSTAMTTIGNNISNSNTTGFKASRTLFSDLLYNNASGSGGVSQVGTGTNLSKVDTLFTQGNFQNTEKSTDMAINGDGFFMVKQPDSTQASYTRAGSFSFDQNGYLVSPEGGKVQGYQLDANGNPSGNLTDLQVQTKSLSPAVATQNITLSTNLNAGAGIVNNGQFNIQDPANTSNYASSVTVYDSLGKGHLVTTYFTKAANNKWTWNSTVNTSDLDINTGTSLSAGQALTPGTALPSPVTLASGTVLPANTNLIAGTTIPSGTVIPQNTIVPSGSIVPSGTVLQSGTVIPNGTAIPQSTVVPQNTVIPTGTKIATGTSIPNGTVVPSGTTIPANTSVPAGTAIPQGTVIPSGTQIPTNMGFSGLTLTSDTTFPAGTTFSANVLLPDGTTLAAGSALSGSTTFTSGTTLPDGTFPAGQVLSLDATLSSAYTPASNLSLAGDTTLAGDMTLNGNMPITGNMTLAGTMTPQADMTLAADTVLGGNMTLASNMTLQGNMRLADAMRLSADTTLGGDMSLGGTMLLPSQMTLTAATTLPPGTTLPQLASSVTLPNNVTFASAALAAAKAAPSDNPQAAADAVKSALQGLIDNSAYADPASSSYDPKLLSLANAVASAYDAAAQTAADNNAGNAGAVVQAVSTTPSNIVVGSGTVNFTPQGELVQDQSSPPATDAGILRWNNGSDQTQQINLGLNVTDYTNSTIVDSTSQDGSPTGSLVQLSMEDGGIIVGNYSNGQPRKLGQVALAKFTNPEGLIKDGSNLYSESDASGTPVIGTSGSGIGKVVANSLEQSNVDLAKEFVNMITTQRAYQANSKTITTTDQMLQVLLNLKQ